MQKHCMHTADGAFTCMLPKATDFCRSRWDATWDSRTELVIVVSYFKDAVDWLASSPYPVHLCGKIGQVPHAKTNDRCKTANIGQEATSYLAFIVNYWDELPRFVAFIHGHESAWHQRHNVLHMLQNDQQWRRRKFTSLNRHEWHVHGPGDPRYEDVARHWSRHFERYLGKLPAVLEFDCCAQFVVSRDVIKCLPKQAYQEFLSFILASKGERIDFHTIGHMMECIWHIIFNSPTFYDGSKSAQMSVRQCASA